MDPIVSSAPLGYLPGTAGVDGGGAATYTIPLSVPPGVRGMQPNLSLSYSSKGGNGILGVGWSLIGGSQIERCHKTLRTDGVTSGYDFSAEDALCLNGAKLTQVGTTPEGPEYRTEASPFDKIVHKVSTDTFEVRSADGRISTYEPLRLPRNKVVDPNADGDPSNDRKELAPWRVTMAADGEVVLMWPLHQVEDRFGNAMRYHYQTTTSGAPQQGQGTSTVLERITYTHHGSLPHGATREVVFEYDGRPEGDRTFTYVNGLRLNQDRRLERIAMVAPSRPGGAREVQWTYRIGYLSSPSAKTGRSQLASVQQCDAAGVCGWKKQFSWQGQGQPLHIEASYSPVSATDEAPWIGCEPPGIVSTETRPILLDADGDGRQDVLLLQTDGLDSCSPSVDTNQFKWKLLLSYAGYTVHTVSNDFFIDNDRGQLAPGRYRVADVDNDGRDDLIAGIDEGDDSLSAHGGRFKYRCFTWASLSDSFVSCMPPETKDESNAGMLDIRWHTGDRLRWPLWNLADFDGDGRVDLAENADVRLNLGLLPSGKVHFQSTQHPADMLDFDDAPNHAIAWPWRAYNRGAEASDIDGDGRAELLLGEPPGVTLHGTAGPDAPLPATEPLLHAMGLSPAGAPVDTGIPGLSRGAVPWARQAEGELVVEDESYFFSVSADINGDGLTDQVIVRHTTELSGDGATLRLTGEDGRGEIGTFVQYNTGRGLTPPLRTELQLRPIEQWLAVGPLTQFDDGDAHYYKWNTSALPAAVDVVDVNHDGRDDLVVKSMETWQWNEQENELELDAVPVLDPPQIGYPTGDTSVNDGSRFWYTRIYLSTGDNFKLIENPFDPGLPDSSGDRGYTFARPAQLDDDPEPEYITRGSAKLPDGSPFPVNAWIDGYMGTTLNRVDLDAGPPEVISAVQDEGASEPREIFKYHDVRFSRTGEGCDYPIACPSHFPAMVGEHHSAQGRDSNDEIIYRRTKYKHHGPRVDLRGRGMLGFDETRTIDLDSGATTITTYDGNTTAVGELFPYAGMPTRVTSFTPILVAPQDGTPNLPAGPVRVRVSETTSTPGHKLLNNGKTYFSYVTEESTNVREQTMELHFVDGEPRLKDSAPENSFHVSFVQTSTQCDDFGNPVESTSSVQGGETRVSTNSYLNDTDTWLVRLPLTQSTRSMNWTRLVGYGYDAQGHLQTVQVQPGDSDPTVRSTTHRVRDDRGLVIQVGQEAPGVAVRVTNLYYDADDVFAAQAINAVGHQSTVLRHPALGVPVLTVDALGVESLARYDGFGRLASTDGPTELDIESIQYSPVQGPSFDPAGIVGIETTTALTDGSARSVATDPMGRAVRSMVTGFDGSLLHAATHYNLFGQAVSVTRMAEGAPSGLTTDTVYDTLGRVLQRSTPDDVQTHFDYGPFETRTTNALGHERRIFYDAQWRPARSEETLVENGQPKTLTTTFHYGAFDLLNLSTDPAGHTVSIRNDVLGRKIRVQDPDAGGTAFAYNGLGELVRKTTPQGQVIAMAYDPIGRPLSVTDSDGTSLYAWDFAPNGTGQLAAALSPDNVVTRYAYDDLGRPKVVRTILDGTETFEIEHGYDGFGRVAEISYPTDLSGQRFSVAFDYNAHGYLKSVSRSDLAQQSPLEKQLVWETLERDENLALTRGKFGNDIVTTWQRDPATGMVEKITAEPGIAVALSTPTLEVTYFYDALRNVKTRQWGGSAFGNEAISETFDYDALDRLTDWNVSGPVSGGAGLRQYRYDTMGNLTGVFKDGQPTYQASYGWGQIPNALATSSLSNLFEYDAGGRQTRAGDREVTYTNFDLPRTATVAGDTTSFRYGPDRRRVEKSGPEARTVYIGGLYEKRVTPAGTQHVFFVPGDTGIVAQVTRTETTTNSPVSEAIVYFTRDHLGSSTAAFNEKGDVATQVFDPWGERIYQSGGGPGGAQSPLMSEVEHGYTDQRHEAELGWIDMNARMYDPAQRRFIATDPLVADALFSTGRNRFAYVRDNPMRYSDPTGLSGVEGEGKAPPLRMPQVHIIGWRQWFEGPRIQDPASYDNGLPAPYERASTAIEPEANAGSAESATEVRPTVASRSNGLLDGRLAARGEMKDWVDIDPGAVDRRGRAIYDCASATDCRSVKADYVWLPVGTSDVEVQLALGGVGKVLGAGWKGLGRLLEGATPAGGAVVEGELAATRAAMNGSLENGATVRYSKTATAIGDDANTLQNFARSRGAAGHDLIVHGKMVEGEGRFWVNNMPTHSQQVADAVLGNPAYQRGMPINLVTCYGACGPAQELQGILGVKVTALPTPVDLNSATGLLRRQLF